MKTALSEQNRMLKDIGIISFTIVELILYLDTHPFDKQAMEYFHHYSHIRSQLMEDFAARYYPLSLANSDDTREWSWALSPMPWENAAMEGGCR